MVPATTTRQHDNTLFGTENDGSSSSTTHNIAHNHARTLSVLPQNINRPALRRHGPASLVAVHHAIRQHHVGLDVPHKHPQLFTVVKRAARAPNVVSAVVDVQPVAHPTSPPRLVPVGDEQVFEHQVVHVGPGAQNQPTGKNGLVGGLSPNDQVLVMGSFEVHSGERRFVRVLRHVVNAVGAGGDDHGGDVPFRPGQPAQFHELLKQGVDRRAFGGGHVKDGGGWGGGGGGLFSRAFRGQNGGGGLNKGCHWWEIVGYRPVVGGWFRFSRAAPGARRNF